MKHIKIFENFNNDKEIHTICRKYGIKNYTINPDHSIDVDGDVDISNKGLTKLPLKFGKVSGYFNCTNNKLTNLKGMSSVGGNFDFSGNNITSLEGMSSIGGGFYCAGNLINEIWKLFGDKDKIELLKDYDPFRTIDGKPTIILDRLNSFLEDIGKELVTKVDGYIIL